MDSPAHTFVLSFYNRFEGRIAISVGYGPGLVEIFPFVFEDENHIPIGIIALAVMVQDEREVVHIYHLGAFKPGGGHGTDMLLELCREANRLLVPISLSPIHFPNGKDELPDDEALDAWYRRFGFTGSEHLVREPQAQ